ELQRIVANTPPGKVVEVKIIREKKKRVLQIKIGEMPTEEELVAEEKESWRGLSVEAISGDLAERFNLRTKKGVIVSNVEPGSPAAESGIVRGMIIRQINREEVKSLNDYYRIIKKIKKKRDVVLLVQEGRYSRFLVLKSEAG
ncbi:MAG: PDZ domain-containing protein, partial [Candidatus Omnitrophica bacterium]|nr:PDZ domain-containing protein [Candidatus Omnitrophota bacterium]